MTDPNTPDEASGGSTLLEVLAEAADDGFSQQIVVTDDGDLRCTKCDTTVAPADFDVVGFRRLEGASDPSDMLIVVWGTCDGCGEGGVATVGYGPNAGPADGAVLDALDLDDATDEVGSAGASAN
ncbi:MAG: hypothetical protein R8G01_00230 [Ilumatobacteraceae bacterium]|nr:hypothetical protein [Ilumatobacteraceae bacterium]